jgi:hypothetical protein
VAVAWLRVELQRYILSATFGGVVPSRACRGAGKAHSAARKR